MFLCGQTEDVLYAENYVVSINYVFSSERDCDYSDTQWYTNTIAPLIYENDDIKNVLGEKTPPVGVAMVAIGMAEKKVFFRTIV